MSVVSAVLTRDQVDPKDCWDLSKLYPEAEVWEVDFATLESALPKIEAFRGQLTESAASLAAFLALEVELERALDKLHTYAARRSDEDTANSSNKGLVERLRSLAIRFSQAAAFFRPELLAVPSDRLQELLASDELANYRFHLEKVVRHKPHTLSTGEEQLLALSGDLAHASYDAFGQLTNADIDFGTIVDEAGVTQPVTHASYSSFLTKPNRDVRRAFFEQYYRGYEQHRYTLASTLNGAVKRNLFYARARNFPTAREAALFNNAIPTTVYDNLLASVHKHLPALHRYFDLRKRILKVNELHFYDIMVPLVPDIDWHMEYDAAVALVIEALAPLGTDYTSTLERGLVGGWVDRYENKGKRSGAYSSGCYDSDPYILLNYRSDNLSAVYTLAHEAGHSMHTWLSKQNQDPTYAGYSIFVAEVASTFNEELLTTHLLKTHDDPRMQAYVLGRAIDDIRGTIFRQTMFADYELAIHTRAEGGLPLSLDDFTTLYREQLVRYFGPRFALDPQLDIECLRIPHFYYNFYVYQYATGLSAAIALSQAVLREGKPACDRYLGFLQAGCSAYPIDVLKRAGVDVTTPKPVDAALAHFDKLVTQFEQVMGQLGLVG